MAANNAAFVCRGKYQFNQDLLKAAIRAADQQGNQDGYLSEEELKAFSANGNNDNDLRLAAHFIGKKLGNVTFETARYDHNTKVPALKYLANSSRVSLRIEDVFKAFNNGHLDNLSKATTLKKLPENLATVTPTQDLSVTSTHCETPKKSNFLKSLFGF